MATATVHAANGAARPGEETLCSWVLGLFADAQHAREQQIKTSQWPEWLQCYWGTLWPEALPSYKAPISINETKLLILQELSDLTDNSPNIFVTSDRATGKRDTEVEEFIHTFWEDNFVGLTLLEAYADAAIWPCGFLEVTWDAMRGSGQGDIPIRARHPESVYPDPRATSDEDWRYVILTDVMDLVEVRQHWPDQGRRVLPDAATHATTQQGGGDGIVARTGALSSPLYPYGSPQPTGGSETGVRVYTCYVRDPRIEMQAVEVHRPDGSLQLRSLPRWSYPQGRLIQCTSNVVLYDDKNPYDDGFPLIQVKLQPSIHSFWPRQSMVSEVLELQRGSDKSESLVLENALRLNKGLIFADTDAGINPKTFADVPGQVHLIRPGRTVRVEYPRPMPPDMVQHGARLRGEMRRILGHMPSRAGEQGQGNVSAELTETEISQSMGLTRLRSRLLLKAVKKLVGMLFARMGQYYLTPRHLPRVVDEEWHTVQWTPKIEWQRYAVHVDPHTFEVQSQTMLKRLYLTLARLGKFPDEDLLRELKIPRHKEVAERLTQQLQLQAQARQQTRGGRR